MTRAPDRAFLDGAVLASAIAVLLGTGCGGPLALRVDDPPSEEKEVPAESVAAAESPHRPASSSQDGTAVVTLGAVLRLAGAENIDVKIVESRLAAARADLELARSQLLPRLSIGASYLRHDGRLQEIQGAVFDVSRSSLSAGPELRLQLDPGAAIAARLEAKQQVRAAEMAAARTRAETVVHSAALYLELLRHQAVVEVARETVEQTRAQVELSRAMVEAEAGLRANLTRATAALAREELLLLEAQNDLRRASVELAIWLRLEPGILLTPADMEVEALTLVDAEIPVAELIATATVEHPGLGELQARRAAAEERTAAQKRAPWIPNLDVFAGYGAFGGGRGSFNGDYGDRFDAGAGLSWSFDGLGFGERARLRKARAELREARFREQGFAERIAGEVTRNYEDVQSLRASIDAARTRQQAATETRELVEARFGAGDAIQLEVLEAAREASAARAAVITAITDYNRTQHLLHYQVFGSAWSEAPAAR